MRNISFKAGLAIATALMFTPVAMAGVHGDTSYNVELNKTQVLRLPEPAAAIVVGNPEIADISVHSSDTIFIVGRGYGQTNLLVLNSRGQTVMNADVQVGNTLPANGVRLYKGGTMRNTYSCAPYCLPAPVLGDDTGFMKANQKGAPKINIEVAASGFPDGMASPAMGGANAGSGNYAAKLKSQVRESR